jgi:hypothetical protein
MLGAMRAAARRGVAAGLAAAAAPGSRLHARTGPSWCGAGAARAVQSGGRKGRAAAGTLLVPCLCAGAAVAQQVGTCMRRGCVHAGARGMRGACGVLVARGVRGARGARAVCAVRGVRECVACVAFWLVLRFPGHDARSPCSIASPIPACLPPSRPAVITATCALRQVHVWANCEGKDEGDGTDDSGHGGKESGWEEVVGLGEDTGEDVPGWHEMEDKPAEEVSRPRHCSLSAGFAPGGVP